MNNSNAFRNHPKIHNKIYVLRDLEGFDVLESRIIEYSERPASRNVKGLRSETRDQIARTLKHLESARRFQSCHGASQVRRDAGKLLKCIRHEPVEAVIERARQFAGTVRKAGCRSKIKERQQAAICYKIDETWSIRELPTVECLKSVGRGISLCVAHDDEIGRDYHSALRDGWTKFWCVENTGLPYALLELDSDNLNVNDARSKGNKVPKIPRAVAVGILEKLGANGDKCEAFARTGAFIGFLGRRDKVPIVSTDCGDVQIWAGSNTFLLALRKSDAKHREWSKYSVDPKRGIIRISLDTKGLSVARLSRLLVIHRELAARVKAASEGANDS